MDIMRVRHRKTGEVYSCFVQAVDLNFNGEYMLRYNIGIKGHKD